MEQALASLKAARSKMRNVADIRITEEINNAISILEEEVARPESGGAGAQERAFRSLSKALRYLPIIEQVLDDLSK
ncbi:MAG: hypothetical protein FKY71_11210 [Spiribacter salinus]|uniref:Uncharacterized protein n=1 Tax=Spiribacter salinus TaxID=1335746 RepID=A0A540VQ98_9GAMM|nr:MAG: hypothetical protein FKY71_11210 [Spiribacter salinus]